MNMPLRDPPLDPDEPPLDPTETWGQGPDRSHPLSHGDDVEPDEDAEHRPVEDEGDRAWPSNEAPPD